MHVGCHKLLLCCFLAMGQRPLQAPWLIISAAEGFWIPLEVLTPITRLPLSLKT